MPRIDPTVTMTGSSAARWEKTPPPLPPRSQVVDELGRGGQGGVWLATDLVFGAPVAV